MAYVPLVVIGAPRSGTNMLRDVLTALPGAETWPCDEINYIWRHGNSRYPSDELRPAEATFPVRRYIRQQFEWVARHYDAQVVVEKTCANSLRVGFVDRVVPEARYVFIYRDGLDAVPSTLRRWTAKADIPYLARKARFVPLSDLPYYASRFVRNRVHRLVSKEERLAFWGPQLDDMDELLKQYTLEEVCGLQWQRCVEASLEALEQMSPDKWIRVAYEDIVRSPTREITRVAEFAGIPAEQELVAAGTDDVSSSSVGKGASELDGEALGRIRSIIDPTRKQLGYD